KPRIRLAIFAAVVVGMTFGLTSQAQANDLFVPSGPFPTIQDAVNAAVPDDVIHVGPGTYNETVTINTARLTLLGDQTGVDARSGRPAAPESIVHGQNPNLIAFDVNAPHTVIDGFKIETSEPGIELRPTASGHTIINNIFDDNTFGVYAN